MSDDLNAMTDEAVQKLRQRVLSGDTPTRDELAAAIAFMRQKYSTAQTAKVARDTAPATKTTKGKALASAETRAAMLEKNGLAPGANLLDMF